MKRLILYVLVVLQLLIGGMATAERRLYEISTIKTKYYVPRGGIAYISDSIKEGDYRIEGRMLLQNISKENVGYEEPILYVYQNNQKIAEIPAVTVTPKSAAPRSFTLISFSEMGIPLDGFDKISLSILSNVYPSKEKEKYIEIGSGDMGKTEHTTGLRISKDISKFKKGIYVVNLIVFDDQGRFVWGEDVTANREYYAEASNALQDYEVALFEKNGLIPSKVYGEVYRKKQY